MINFIANLIMVVFWLITAPIISIAYICTFIHATAYYGVVKANKHMDYIIAYSDKRKAERGITQ